MRSVVGISGLQAGEDVNLELAGIYLQRIDWLVSGDDSEESFHERLQEDLSLYKVKFHRILTKDL